MRKQYHLRPGAQGLRAWDVERLIALSRDLPPRWIALSVIRELDEPYWFGALDPEPTCQAVMDHARLINQVDLRFPVILSADGRVMDGMHRIARAAMLGHTHVLAVQFERDPEPDHVGVHPDDLPY